MTDATLGQTERRISFNSRRAERRREVARAVKDARERLTSSTGTRRALDHEITLAYARTRLGAGMAIPVLVVAAGALSWFSSGDLVVALWAVAALIAHALVLIAAKRFSDTPAGPESMKPLRRRFVALELLQGLVWAALFVLPGGGLGLGASLDFAAVLIVLAAASMTTSALPPAVWAATVPVAIAGAARLAAGLDVPAYVLAACTLGACAFFIMLARWLHSSNLLMIEYRAQKDALIVELEHATAVAEESRRRAEEANSAKSRFLATMSHELRTPLNAILGFSEIIKGEVFGPIGNASYKDYVNDIHNSGKHLLHLINEILDLSRIEAGKHELSEEAILLADIVDDCRHLIAVKAKGKGIALAEQVEPRLPKVWADPRAVRQIVLNLLSNAVKFTQSDGEVMVRVGWTAGGGQYISVRDNGPGIPENEIPIVLSAFGQGSIAIKSAEQGTGLGLPIVQALVQMHGGNFRLESKLREGTEVIVTFPPQRVMAALPAIAEPEPARAAV